MGRPKGSPNLTPAERAAKLKGKKSKVSTPRGPGRQSISARKPVKSVRSVNHVKSSNSRTTSSTDNLLTLAVTVGSVADKYSELREQFSSFYTEAENASGATNQNFEAFNQRLSAVEVTINNLIGYVRSKFPDSVPGTEGTADTVASAAASVPPETKESAAPIPAGSINGSGEVQAPA